MDIIKLLNSKPKITNNGEELDYQKLCIIYNNHFKEWDYSVQIEDIWYDIIIDGKTTIETDTDTLNLYSMEFNSSNAGKALKEIASRLKEINKNIEEKENE